MTREEAIENIKKALPLSKTLEEAFYTLHPELAESEDERIRKSLIDNFKHYSCTSDGTPSYKVLAWLEKQKDFQTKVQQRMEYLWDKLPDSHKVEDEDCTPEEWKALGAYMELEMNFDESEEKQKEQKPAEYVNVKITDGYPVVSSDKIVEDSAYCGPGVTVSGEEPAEWSDEDERNVRDTIVAVEAFYSKGCGQEELVSWLKSLRLSWKPSEEQIYSLGTVVKGYDECAVGSVGYNLKEMYEQLKKL
jgi:hypothetical protein